MLFHHFGITKTKTQVMGDTNMNNVDNVDYLEKVAILLRVLPSKLPVVVSTLFRSPTEESLECQLFIRIPVKLLKTYFTLVKHPIVVSDNSFVTELEGVLFSMTYIQHTKLTIVRLLFNESQAYAVYNRLLNFCSFVKSVNSI